MRAGSVARTAATLAAGVAYRASGADRLAATLIERSASEDENTSTVAKMMLTRPAAVPHVAAAVRRGRADLVTVLQSIGTDKARRALEALATHDDDAVAGAASEAVRQLRRTDGA